MPITGLDHLMLAVPDLPVAVTSIAASLGLRLERGVTHPDFGTANRTIRIPGLFLELITIVDRERAATQPVGRRIAEVADDGGGWLSAVLAMRDAGAVVESAAARGLDLGGPEVGRAVRPDGTVRRWWLAGHATDHFRRGRLPSLIEYESAAELGPVPDDLGYRLLGVTAIDYVCPELATSEALLTRLTGTPPKRGTDRATGHACATHVLPDGVSLRLLERADGARTGLSAVVLRVDDLDRAAGALGHRGIGVRRLAGGTDGVGPGRDELALDPRQTAQASFRFTTS